MKEKEVKDLLDKIFIQVFGKTYDYTVDQVKGKFAFSLTLPKEVRDSTTNEVTYSYSSNSYHFITQTNMSRKDSEEGWMLDKKEFHDLKEVIDVWNQINLLTTERVYESSNVSKSDTIYSSINVYQSADCRNCKNIIFCESCGDCEDMLASKRTATSNYCICTDDSKDCNNSYLVVCSNKVHHSLFIQDCFNLYECMFCAHIANKQYCICNMQFTKEEYFKIKEIIIEWILNSY